MGYPEEQERTIFFSLLFEADGVGRGAATFLCHTGKFHLSEAEGDAQGNEARIVLAVGGGSIEGVDDAGVPSTPVEDVADIQFYGHAAVEEIGISTQVNTFFALIDPEDVLCAAAVVGVDKKLVVFP